MKNGVVSIGVVGYGYWGPNLVRNYREYSGCEVKYVCDSSKDQLRKAAGRYPDIKTTENFEELLGDRELDAVIVATPISTHHSLASQAINAGKHVFVEKPLASSAKEARALIDEARAEKVVLMVGHTFEFSPPVVKIKELISEGELGRIYYISSSRINLGLHQNDASVIWDLAPHDFSILFYWLGEEASKIEAFGKSCIKSSLSDVAFVNMSFPSGVIAEVQLSWLSPIKLRRTIIVGSRKMLLYDDTENVEKVKIFDHGVHLGDPHTYGEFQLSYRTGDVVSPNIQSYEPLYAEAGHFLECVNAGKRPQTDGENGLRVVKALEQAERSLQHNKRVDEAPWVVYPVSN